MCQNILGLRETTIYSLDFGYIKCYDYVYHIVAVFFMTHWNFLTNQINLDLKDSQLLTCLNILSE